MKKCKMLGKSGPNSCQKSQNVYIKTQFESPKDVQETTLETLYLQKPCFVTVNLGANVNTALIKGIP